MPKDSATVCHLDLPEDLRKGVLKTAASLAGTEADNYYRGSSVGTTQDNRRLGFLVEAGVNYLLGKPVAKVLERFHAGWCPDGGIDGAVELVTNHFPTKAPITKGWFTIQVRASMHTRGCLMTPTNPHNRRGEIYVLGEACRHRTERDVAVDIVGWEWGCHFPLAAKTPATDRRVCVPTWVIERDQLRPFARLMARCYQARWWLYMQDPVPGGKQAFDPDYPRSNWERELVIDHDGKQRPRPH